MPITLLDILLLVVMLISGLLAMIRGFMREILSIGAWGIAALVTLYSYARVLPIAKQYFSSDMVAAGVSVGGIFLLHAADRIDHHGAHFGHDPRQPGRRARPHAWVPVRTGPRFDHRRRRLLVLCLAGALTKASPTGCATQSRKSYCKSTGEWLKGMLPDDPESTILKRLKKPKPDDQDAPPDATPGQRSEIQPPMIQAQRIGTR